MHGSKKGRSHVAEWPHGSFFCLCKNGESHALLCRRMALRDWSAGVVWVVGAPADRE